MTDTLTVEFTGTIKQPLPIVSKQFGDIRHHAKHRVHPNIAFTVLSEQNGVCHLKQEVALLGMKQMDKVFQKRLSDGSLESEVVAGTNKGSKLFQSFQALEPNATLIKIRLQIPLSGIKKLLKPFIRMALLSTLKKAFEEDRIDLEDKGYPRA
ncbi:hypothetical protein EPO44_22360 [bacterium]|nr:MAG: hypothetical protein EPO44_22360 [bacterium]